MPDEPLPLIDQYIKMVEQFSPIQADAGTIHTIDQNIGLIRSTATALDLDLRDPEVLRTVIKAHALITSWTLNHIHQNCQRPDCLQAAAGHAQLANGQLAVHLHEMSKYVIPD